MNRETFLENENWAGSFCELCLELGPRGDDEHLLRALNSLWAQPQLHGSWVDRTNFEIASPQTKIVDDAEQPRFGVLTLGHGLQVGCKSVVVRESDADGTDWLDLCIPTGMLELIYPVSYPLSSDTNPWLREIDQVLAIIGAAVFREVPFLMGSIGEEVSGMFTPDVISSNDLRRDLVFLLPKPLKDSLSKDVPEILVAPGLVATGLSRE